MHGLYGAAKFSIIGFGIFLLGMTVGGDSHQAAIIVTRIFHGISRYPLLSLGVFIGLAIGFSLGGDRALQNLGEFERRQRKHRIGSV